jgi:DNA modification methylase
METYNDLKVEWVDIEEIKPYENNAKEHPAEYIKSLTDLDDGVIEPFCGSGSTLIACEQLGRKCYGMELDPKYMDVIIRRWEEYTGKKAEKIE